MSRDSVYWLRCLFGPRWSTNHYYCVHEYCFRINSLLLRFRSYLNIWIDRWGLSHVRNDNKYGDLLWWHARFWNLMKCFALSVWKAGTGFQSYLDLIYFPKLFLYISGCCVRNYRPPLHGHMGSSATFLCKKIVVCFCYICYFMWHNLCTKFTSWYSIWFS